MPLLTRAALVFETVVTAGSIRKASERINLAPSAIDRQVLNLEAEMGTPLLTRHARGMTPTEAGKLVVDRIRAWQGEDQALRGEIEMLKGRKGLVRIGIMECFTRTVLPAVFRRLEALHGATTLDVFTGGTARIAQRMQAGELDLAVAFNMPGDLGLRVLFETALDIGIVLRPTPDLVRKGALARSDLQGRHVVLSDRSLTVEPIVRAMMERMGLNSQAIARSNSIEAIKSLVMAGAGVGFLTWADVCEEVRRGDLLFLPMAAGRATEVLSLTGRPPAQTSQSASALSAILIDTLAGIAMEAKALPGAARG